MGRKKEIRTIEVKKVGIVKVKVKNFIITSVEKTIAGPKKRIVPCLKKEDLR